jgi:monothiol glutaredoxin
MSKEQVPEPLRQKIEGLLTEHETVLFMKGTKLMPACGFSARVVQTLNQLGRDFHSVDVLKDPEIREGIKVFTDWPTLPQLYHKGQFIGGCDIVTAMHAKGELKAVLGD